MMNLLLLTPDIPFPPNKGQRADVWRRIQVFQRNQVAITIVYFYDEFNKKQHNDFVELSKGFGLMSVGIMIKRSPLLDIQRLLKSLITKVPYHALTRVPQIDDLNKLRVLLELNKPDVVWMEGLWIGETYKLLIKSKLINLPFYYRSHNIEFEYMRSQLSIRNHFSDKLKRLIQVYPLKSYEIDFIKKSKITFDISSDDANFWRNKGFDHVEVLPPLPESALISSIELEALRSQSKNLDVLFLGNLKTPNNVKGVSFLVSKVLPILLIEHPAIKLVIAGSSPTHDVLEICTNNPNVRLMSNVPDAFKLMCQAKVLVNPVATGSGVMVKMLDMLMTNQPIVTTSQGVCGLPESIKKVVSIADNPDDFAKFIISIFNAKESFQKKNDREEIRNYFSAERIESLVLSLKNDL